MTLSLTREQETLIKEQISKGRYTSQDAVIDEALSLLQRHEKALEKLRTEIQEGLDDLAAGRSSSYTKETSHELADEVKRRGRELKASREKSA
jgi:putative addiction module CopG family antidote